MDVLAILIKSLAKKLGGAFARLERGEITAAQWFDVSARLLARYHLAALMSGLGRPRLSQDDLLVSWELINGQLQYLDAFRLQIQSAAEFQAGWESRAQSYAQAIKVPYWKGQTKMLPLPAMPAQGTQCMNNCGCAWNIIPIDEEAGDYDCYWERGKNDSCQTCIERERQWNPLQIRGGMLVNTKAYTLKHLAGEHDQKTHAGGGGAGDDLAGHLKSLNAQTYTDFGAEGTPYQAAMMIEVNHESDSGWQSWYNGLDKGEIGAIMGYTNGDYTDINTALSNSDKGSAAFEKGQIVNKAIKKGAMPENSMLYRGFESDTLAKAIDGGELGEGGVYQWAGLSSSSFLKQQAENRAKFDEYQEAPAFVLRIQTPKGTRGAYMGGGLGAGGLSREAEFIFPSNTKFAVMKITKEQDSKFYPADGWDFEVDTTVTWTKYTLDLIPLPNEYQDD